MAGSAAGGIKTAARRIGVTVEEYRRRRSAGEKWCGKHRDWHPLGSFGSDRSRSDGLNTDCVEARLSRSDRPGQRERRKRAVAGLRWCRGCRSWLAATEVYQGACRVHLRAEERARYTRDGRPVGRDRRHLETPPRWWAQDTLATFGGRCAYGCGRPATAWDHIWPVSRGGLSRPGNLVPACRSCNSGKRDRHPLIWINRGLTSEQAGAWTDVLAIAIEVNCDDWEDAA